MTCTLRIRSVTPIVEISEKKCDGCNKCVERCPRKVLKLEKKKASVDNLKACILCESCEEACPNGAIKARGDETKFMMTFDTDGAVPALRALTYALKKLEEEFTEFREKLGEELE